MSNDNQVDKDKLREAFKQRFANTLNSLPPNYTVKDIEELILRKQDELEKVREERDFLLYIRGQVKGGHNV